MSRTTRPPGGATDRCFAAVAKPDAETLVLGSLPGRRSLAMQQYYAHPQNAFWKLIAAIYSAEADLPYEQRVRLLEAHHVALWDVLATAERPGSLDSAIVHHSVQVNDFGKFFRGHPRIRRVFFNGRKAETLFLRLAAPKLAAEFPDIQYECLPSTSPAHAGMTFARKLASWQKIKEHNKE